MSRAFAIFVIMASILILEDDATFAQIIEVFLLKNDFQVSVAGTLQQALKQIDRQHFDLLLLDYRLPDGTGLDALLHARAQGNATPAIIMTSFNDVRTAVRSMQSGATDYITKPVNPEELLMLIQSSVKNNVKSAPADALFIKGNHPSAHKLYDHIHLVAQTNMSVLIQGESGTCKEFAAKLLHTQSKRKDHAFIAIDCGSLSKELAASELFGHVKGAFTGALQDKKGQFELAHGGTIFLDEIGNLSYEVQVKLLRALQERCIHPVGATKPVKIDVRLIAATNDDLLNSIKEGHFREDLYHRINEFKLLIPPLREREDDLGLFIDHFVELANKELGRAVKRIAPAAKRMLLDYDWPGNLRELKNVIKRMVLLSTDAAADVDTLPEEMQWQLSATPQNPTTDLRAIHEDNEKRLITEILSKVKYNKTKAAKLLNIDRKTLYSKMERYGIT